MPATRDEDVRFLVKAFKGSSKTPVFAMYFRGDEVEIADALRDEYRRKKGYRVEFKEFPRGLKNPIGEALIGGLAAGTGAAIGGAIIASNLGKRRNPGSGQQMAEAFHGRASERETIFSTDVVEENDLAVLGILTEFEIYCANGRDVVPLEFAELDERTKYVHVDTKMNKYLRVCCNGAGTQLYFIGQPFRITSSDFARMIHDGLPIAASSNVAFIGEVHSISYFADKHHLSGPKEQERGMHYIHELGEETGIKPFLVYDKLNETLHFVGGDYHVEDVGIVN